MTLDPGEIVLVPFPFTDLTSSKTRPALVLSCAPYNEASRDAILLGMTSNLANSDHSVLIDNEDLASGRLVATSRVKVDKVVTLEQRLIRRTVGKLEPEVLFRVLREFQALLPADR